MSKPRFGVAVEQLPQLSLGAQVAALESAGVEEWHVELADGHFVPWLCGSVALVRELAAMSSLPVHVHVRTQQPERHLEALAASGCKGVAVPIEACGHVHRTLDQIRELGLEPGVSLCAATPLTRLEYVLGMVSRVVLASAEPSRATPRYVKSALERTRILADNLRYRESRAVLQVSGALDAGAAARIHRVGAHVMTLGRDAFGEAPVSTETFLAFLESFSDQRHLV